MVSVEIIMKLNEGFQPFLVVIGMILISSFISILFYVYISNYGAKYNKFMNNTTLSYKFIKVGS